MIKNPEAFPYVAQGPEEGFLSPFLSETPLELKAFHVVEVPDLFLCTSGSRFSGIDDSKLDFPIRRSFLSL